jgi:hypothetical protein
MVHVRDPDLVRPIAENGEGPHRADGGGGLEPLCAEDRRSLQAELTPAGERMLGGDAHRLRRGGRTPPRHLTAEEAE